MVRKHIYRSIFKKSVIMYKFEKFYQKKGLAKSMNYSQKICEKYMATNIYKNLL